MGAKFKDFLFKSKFNYKKANYYKKCYDKILELGLFDVRFYLTCYPHIAKSKMDPLFHYLFHGYKENKVPNPSFDLIKYLKENPEVEKNNLNPLIHYLENNKDGFILDYNPVYLKKKRILETNILFLRNERLDDEPLVSIIILNRNGLNHLKRLFMDFDEKTNYSNYEIILVDNASCDGSLEYLYSLKEVLPIKIIENNENVSFSKGNNDAVKIAKGEYVLLLNNDIEPTFGWLKELMLTMVKNDKVGAVGAKLLFPYYSELNAQEKSFSIQHAGVKFREEITPYIYGPYHENMYLTLLFSDKVNNEKEVIANTAACLLVPRDLYLELGGLDEGYFYGYEDIDFAFKILDKGYSSFYSPQSLLFHYESATRLDDSKVHEINYKNIMYFKSRWEDKLSKDILIDKLYNINFITSKKLFFTIINTDRSKNKFINVLSKYLNDRGYNINLIESLDYINVGQDCDILISFNKDFDVNKLYSRLNLIKILVSSENNNDYDIFLLDNKPVEEFIEILLKNIEDYYV